MRTYIGRASKKVTSTINMISVIEFFMSKVTLFWFRRDLRLNDNAGLYHALKQYVPKKVDEIFPFFSAAENLETITPPSLSFKIEKVSTAQIQKGTLIDYKLKIRGVPVKWRTEIAAWEPGKYFVDQQLKGPYKLWHHTHDFKNLGPGTLMTDVVRYKSPMGFMGWIVAGALVKSEISGIFNYRRKIIFDKFFKS